MGYSFYNKKKRKGFTLVELLVVIAILAVLAGVSVVGYLSFIKKAKVSNDISLTTQMNTILNANKAADDKNDTPHDAVEDLIDGGLNVNKLTPTTNGYNYVYDLENDEMILLDEGMNLVAPEHKALRDSKISYFVFLENETELKSTNYNGYSFYLKNEFTSDNSLEVSTGIDVGENSISTINYNNQNKQTALIRTNGGTLNVTAPEDTINHFGWIKELDVTSVATSDCFHEHGYVGNLAKFESGRFICYEGSEFHQTENAIRTLLGDKGQDLPKGKYGEHHYDHGKCDIDDCSNPYDPKHEHTWGEWKITQAATCTTGGTKEHKCTECGYAETETITALGHSYEYSYTDSDYTNHTKKCSRCNNEVTENHSWGEWTTTAATCTSDGIKERTCSACSMSQTEKDGDAKGHTFTYSNITETTHDKKCSVCGNEVKSEAHNYTNGQCVCGKQEEIVKNGLCSDGYYYKDGVRYTGTITDGSDTYEYKEGRLVVSASIGDIISDYIDYKITYDITSIGASYATKEIILKTSDNIDTYIENAYTAGGYSTASNIVINSTSNSYEVKSINLTYDMSFKGAIDYLKESIGSKTKDEILNTLSSTYEFNESFYPVITLSDDFKRYLEDELQISNINNNKTSISEDTYKTIQNSNFSGYLKNKYNITNIENLSWEDKVNYSFSSYYFPSNNKNNKKNGFFSGNAFECNGEYCVFNDPELILLYFEHTYENIIFTGISSDSNKINTLLKDVAGADITTNAYKNGGEDWKEEVAKAYSIPVNSVYKDGDEKTYNIDTLGNKTNFYIYLASHAYLMTNMYQSRDFTGYSYTVIAENPNWTLS